MSLSRSRLRSELPNATETSRLLSKIKALYDLSPAHMVLELGATRYRGQDLFSLAFDPTQTTGTFVVQRPGPAAAKASKVIQDLTYTADSTGTAGNSITIHYTTGGTAGSEAVGVVGSAITVQIQSGVSTATQVKAAVDAAPAAAALVDITISGTAGTAQTAPVAATNLAGGITAPSVETYDIADIRMIKRLRTKKWLIAIKADANPA